MRDVFTVAKKELRAFFSDKVILMQMFLLPFVIVFGYGMLMSAIMEAGTEPSDTEVKAYSINAPIFFDEALSQIDVVTAPDGNTEKYIAEVKEGRLDLLVVFPKDFAMAEHGAEKLSDIEVYYNSNNNSSMRVYSAATMLFTSMQPQLFTVNSSPDKEYNLFDDSVAFRMFLGSVIPMMVFMAVFMICMNLAANSIAGDKEHGFLNTLLITPAKRSSLAAGKSLAILVVAIVGSISAFVGMAVSLPKLASAMELESSVSYRAVDYAALLLSVVTGAFVFAIILLLVSTLSKDVKQATTISPLFLLVIVIPSLLSSTGGFSASIERLGTLNYLIPAWNSSQLLRNVIELNYTAQSLVITCLANLITSAAGIFIMGKLFENEKIING